MTLEISRRSLLIGAAATAATPALSTFLPSAALAADAAAVGGNSRESFTIAVLPDTQHSMKSFPVSFTTQIDWLLANRDSSWKVRCVVHVGDIVHNGTDTTQWARARDGFARLDNRVPLAVAPGNHDFNNVDTRNLTNYNTYVPYSKFNLQRTAGGTAADLGAYPANTTNNTWHQFTAGGTDWAIISLAYNPTAAELAWARSVVAAHPDKQFIVNTHDYLVAGTGQRGPTGERIWNDFVKLYPNIFMVLCGHSFNGGPKRKFSTGVNGNRVEEILADYQNADDPVPNSYLRIMQFHPANGTIVVKTYSPRYNTYLTDAQNQFTLTNIRFPLRAPQVRRHILNPEIRAEWHLSAYDHWFMPAGEADKFPDGAVLDFSPTVLQASGGTGLFVLDRGYKRHIAGPRAYQLWRFTADDRVVISPEQLAAYPSGPIWPRYPHLIRPEGRTAIYFLDTPFP